MINTFSRVITKSRSVLAAPIVRSFGSDSPPFDAERAKSPANSDYYMKLEWDHGSHNYHPVPVVLSRGKGVEVWDVEGRKYFDFLSAYSAVNQGHSHPKIIQAMIDQAQKISLTSRAFYNDQLGPWEKYITEVFGYDRALFMNSGVEGGETAIKIARRWAYDVKGIPDNSAKILFAKNNFWGRTLAACASSNDPSRYRGFGPFELNFELVEYGNIDAFESVLKSDPNIAAYMVEPIQGEAGVIIPPEGYLKKVKALCEKYKVLLICDEVQTGLGRTGKLLASDWEGVKPDLLVLGKALSGGMYPVSVVLANNEAMMTIKPGEHGSTYGGNPLGSAIGKKALEVLFEEGMIENSQKQGAKLFQALKDQKRDFIHDVRGRGLFVAFEVVAGHKTVNAWNMCLKLKDKGLLAKPTHDNTIR